MKKVKLMLLLLAILCVLCACGQSKPEQTEEPPAETYVTEPDTEAETAAPTEEPTEPTEPTQRPAVEVAREMIQNGQYQDAIAQLETEESEEADLLRLRAGLGNVKAGDQLILGHFEQDNDMGNGAEEIIWVVLAVEDQKAFLLSLSCLDTQPYHDVFDGRTTWEGSTLRAWLNGEFHDAAFSETEQKIIAETELVNLDNPDYHTPGGENTLDRVFLISLDEARTYLTKELLYAKVTPYAAGRDCYKNATGNGWWWLRSPGVYSRDAAYISAVGDISDYGYVIHRKGWAIRPAIWIDLNV